VTLILPQIRLVAEDWLAKVVESDKVIERIEEVLQERVA